MDSVNYRTYKTTMGQKYRMRVPEDEKHERRLFHAVLILFPALTVVLFDWAAGVL